MDNGKVVLQGHPTTHAYIREALMVRIGNQTKKLLDLVKTAEGSDLPDWDHRT